MCIVLFLNKEDQGMEDMKGRVSKARSALTKLKKILNSNNISKKTINKTI